MRAAIRVEIKRKNVKINGENPAPLLAGPARGWCHRKATQTKLLADAEKVWGPDHASRPPLATYNLVGVNVTQMWCE